MYQKSSVQKIVMAISKKIGKMSSNRMSHVKSPQIACQIACQSDKAISDQSKTSQAKKY